VDVNTVNLFKERLVVLGEPRCQIRFHCRPDRNWR